MNTKSTIINLFGDEREASYRTDGVMTREFGYVGIDPGTSGGLAMLIGDKVAVTSMPRAEPDVWAWLEKARPRKGRTAERSVFAVVEKVGGFIRGKELPGSAMFNFGRGAGILIGCLIAAGIPYEEVTPQRWQKAMGVSPRKKGESKTSFKNRLKERAYALFPREAVTLSTCDALLIAEFCRRWREGRL